MGKLTDRDQNLIEFEVGIIQQNLEFQAIPAMHSPRGTQKPPNLPLSFR